MTQTPETIDLRQCMNAVIGQVHMLRTDFEFMTTLYRSDERVALLQATGGGIFARLQVLLTREILLSLRRLTDNSSTKRRNGERLNLSLQLLIAAASWDDNSEKQSIAVAVSHLRGRVEQIRSVVDRRIAHNDLAVHLSHEVIESPTIAEIRRAIDDVEKIVGDLQVACFDIEQAWSPAGRDAGSEVDGLLAYLVLGNEEHHRRRAKFVAGEMPQSELWPSVP